MAEEFVAGVLANRKDLTEGVQELSVDFETAVWLRDLSSRSSARGVAHDDEERELAGVLSQVSRVHLSHSDCPGEVSLSQCFPGLRHLRMSAVKPQLVSDLSEVVGPRLLRTLKVTGALTSLRELVSLEDQFSWVHLEALSVEGNWLRSVDESLGQLGRSKLTRLNLSRNLLVEVPSTLTLAPHLVWVDLGFNKISSLEGASACFAQGLRCLVLRSNEIRCTRGLEGLTSLEEVDLGSNLVASFDEVRRLAQIRTLQAVWFDGNPLADGPEYRSEVCRTFNDHLRRQPELAFTVDGEDLSAEEKAKAVVVVENLAPVTVVRRPPKQRRVAQLQSEGEPGITARQRQAIAAAAAAISTTAATAPASLVPGTTPVTPPIPTRRMSITHVGRLRIPETEDDDDEQEFAEQDMSWKDRVESIKESAGDGWLSVVDELQKQVPVAAPLRASHHGHSVSPRRRLVLTNESSSSHEGSSPASRSPKVASPRREAQHNPATSVPMPRDVSASTAHEVLSGSLSLVFPTQYSTGTPSLVSSQAGPQMEAETVVPPAELSGQQESVSPSPVAVVLPVPPLPPLHLPEESHSPAQLLPSPNSPPPRPTPEPTPADQENPDAELEEALRGAYLLQNWLVSKCEVPSGAISSLSAVSCWGFSYATSTGLEQPLVALVYPSSLKILGYPRGGLRRISPGLVTSGSVVRTIEVSEISCIVIGPSFHYLRIECEHGSSWVLITRDHVRGHILLDRLSRVALSTGGLRWKLLHSTKATSQGFTADVMRARDGDSAPPLVGLRLYSIVWERIDERTMTGRTLVAAGNSLHVCIEDLALWPLPPEGRKVSQQDRPHFIAKSLAVASLSELAVVHRPSERFHFITFVFRVPPKKKRSLHVSMFKVTRATRTTSVPKTMSTGALPVFELREDQEGTKWCTIATDSALETERICSVVATLFREDTGKTLVVSQYHV